MHLENLFKGKKKKKEKCSLANRIFECDKKKIITIKRGEYQFKKKRKYRLKRNRWNCSKNLSPFRIKVECREKSRFYTNCTVFKMARPPCKIILNDPLVPCNFTDLTRTPRTRRPFSFRRYIPRQTEIKKWP